jgi:UDP-3-O-acyl-N-acetylglucosamine deacetylase
MAKNKVPKELMKQITVIEGVIKGLNDFTDTEKVQMMYYGVDFQEALIEMQKDAMTLRGKLEIFKNKMEEAATYTFYESARFASSDRVVDGFLSGTIDE